MRFYKSTANTGSHVGNLWTNSGTLLATGTFSGESATGWQQLNFTTPVDITAGTTYVASYYAPRGHYSVSSEYYYTPSPVGGNSLDSPPLHAINANRGGANGVYSYSGSSTFPSSTFDGENYAVDVVFAPKLPPGAVSNVTATPGPGSATVNFTAPATGGPPTRYIVTPFIGSTAQPVGHRDRHPAGDVGQGRRPRPGDLVHLQGPGRQRQRHRSALGRVQRGHAERARRRPARPTALVASAANQQATVRWTAPNDGGRTITRYTVTPYLGGVAQATTSVTGSPAPTTAVVTGLNNGSAYTFTVAATNSVGAGPDSAPSSAVTPNASPQFVQKVSGVTPTGSSMQLTPASAITTGNRIVVMAGVWSFSAATISSVTDAAGNTYTKVASVKASDDTELSVWTAPITAGGGTKPAITDHRDGQRRHRRRPRLSTPGCRPRPAPRPSTQLKTATGTATAAGFVTSGPTPALTGDNGLALGFYADSGFGRTLSADPSYTERVNVSPRSDMEFVAEDALPLRGDTPAARVSTGSNTPWTMATVVFKSGTVSPPALSVSPTSLAFSGTAGGASPAAKTLTVTNAGGGTMNWTASESASWLSLSPTSGTNNGTITATPSITGLAAGTYTTDVTVTATRRRRLAEDDPRDLHGRSATPPALSVSPTSLSFTATQGGASPAAKTLSVSNTGGGSMDWTASDGAAWLSLSPDERHERGHDHGDAVDHRPGRGHLHDRRDGHRAGRDGLAEDDPGDPHGRSADAARAVGHADEPVVHARRPAAPTRRPRRCRSATPAAARWTGRRPRARRWLSLSPTSGTNAGTITATPSITGLAAGTYTTDITVTAAGATGSPKTIPVTLTVDPPAAAGAVGLADDAGLHRHGGRHEPGGQDGVGHQHGRRHARRHRVRRRRVARGDARQRHGARDAHRDADHHRAGGRDLHGDRHGHRDDGRGDRLAQDDRRHADGQPGGLDQPRRRLGLRRDDRHDRRRLLGRRTTPARSPAPRTSRRASSAAR